MNWSQAECGWQVVYANDLNEAEEKYENGDYVIEEDDEYEEEDDEYEEE